MTCDVCHDDQFPGSLVGKNLVCIICYPLMPEHIREWLRVNDDVPADKLKCPVCGEWLTGIDHLAPYHWETCWCSKCQNHPYEPKRVIPRPNSVISDGVAKTKDANALNQTK